MQGEIQYMLCLFRVVLIVDEEIYPFVVNCEAAVPIGPLNNTMEPAYDFPAVQDGLPHKLHGGRALEGKLLRRRRC